MSVDWDEPTFEFIGDELDPNGIHCFLCGRDSFNSMDVRYQLCAHCSIFHGELRVMRFQIKKGRSKPEDFHACIPEKFWWLLEPEKREGTDGV